MSAIDSALALKRIFGLDGEVKDNIHYIDEAQVVYPAGNNLVCYHLEKKTQRIIPLSGPGFPDLHNGTGQITALAVSPYSSTRSKLLAVAEKGENTKSTITIFDLATLKRKGKHPLVNQEVKEIVCMSFSMDGKYLLAQGGAPDWMLINWQWEKARPLQSAKVSNPQGAAINECSFCPMDPSVVCVTGNHILRFLHLEQAEFKSIILSMGKREAQNYMCHCWIDENILVGTDTGDILVFENSEFKGVLESSPADGKSIDSIVAFSKGFVCGCDEGILYVFERNVREIFKQSKSFQIDGNYVRIRSLAISPSEEYVTCTLENNQAYVLGLSNTDILKADEMNFEPLSVHFHHLAITGLDVCIRKPLLVTCGIDRSIRIWNYQTKTIEVMHFFTEHPHSVAFHPSGLFILVGFTDCLRLINILMDELRPYKEFPIKSCRECQFSNGGHYFAAANGAVIQLFSTYTGEHIGSFNAHKGKVTSLCWREDDLSLISAGMDGYMYEWRLKDGTHVQDHRDQCSYLCAIGAPNGQVYIAGTDSTLKVIEHNEVTVQIPCGSHITALAFPQSTSTSNKSKFLFAGTSDGVIRVLQTPLTGTDKTFDLHTHRAAVTRLRVCPHDSYLFSVSDDGTLAMFEIDNRDIRNNNRRVRHEYALPLAEEILITKTDLMDRISTINGLKYKIEELIAHNKHQVQLRELTYQDRLHEVQEKYTHELDLNREKYLQLVESKQVMEYRFQDRKKQLLAIQKANLEELNAHQSKQIAVEQARHAALKTEMGESHKSWEEQNSAQEKEFAKEHEELHEKYGKKLDEARERKQTISVAKAVLIQEFEEVKGLMEEDADNEINELKAAYDKKLSVEKTNTLRLKEKNAILKRKFGALRDDINDNLDDLQKMKENQQFLYDEIDALDKDIQGHQKEITERDSTIKDKVGRIVDLKKKNQELEKFKFVLDYKITELNRQIEPRQLEIKQISEQISQMKAELAGYQKENSHLQLRVKELKLKYNGMEKEIADRAKDREVVESHLRRFDSDLIEVFADYDNPKLLKDGVKKLYHAHVTEQTVNASTTSNDLHKHYQRQRHYLERSVDSYNLKLKKDQVVHKKDNLRIMQENIALIKEINQLRREIHHMKQSQKLMEEIKRNKRTDKRTEMLKAREKLSAVSSNRRLKMQREIEMQADEVKSLQGQLRALGMGTDDDYMQDPFKQVGNSSPPAANQTGGGGKADEVSRPLTSEGRFPPIGGGVDNSSFAASTLRVN